MERAFLITKESDYYKDFQDYMDKVKCQKEFVKKFFKENNISAEKYYVGGNGCCNCPFDENEKNEIRLSIIPTNEDLEKYEKQLNKKDKYGFRDFRGNSKISKLFADYCVENEVLINITRLDLRDYLKSMDWVGYEFQRVPCPDGFYVRVSSQLLKKDDNPKGFVPIKLSEFYKELEEYESAIKSK